VQALFDSNILIDYLNGYEQAKKELALYESRVISVVSWIEVMAGCQPHELDATESWLTGFDIVALDSRIAARTARLRREAKSKKMRLPDAIILATAAENGFMLVTRNTKDFDATLPMIRVPYTLK